MVRFDIHPDIHNVDRVVTKTLSLNGRKVVKSSTANTEHRIVIKTKLTLGGRTWPIKLTLTDRSTMQNLMLLGRQAMQKHILVDPSQEFLVPKDSK